jgi:hypothetical protein
VTCWNQHNCWSEGMLINLDTVGVTGSIPVSPTSMFMLVRRPFDGFHRKAVLYSRACLTVV